MGGDRGFTLRGRNQRMVTPDYGPGVHTPGRNTPRPELTKRPPGPPGGLFVIPSSGFRSPPRWCPSSAHPAGAVPDGGHGMAHHFVVEASSLTVAAVIHRPVRGDAQMARRLHCVDVGSQKEELPSIFSLLTPDHLLDPLGRVAAAGIFHAVGGDDEKGMLRHILRPGILVNVSDVVDGSADGIQQRGAAPDIVFLSGDRLTSLAFTRSWSASVQSSKRMVETKASPGSLFCFSSMALKPPMVLLFSPCIEPLRSRMNTSSVRFFFITNSPYSVLFGLQAQHRGRFRFIGRPSGDKLAQPDCTSISSIGCGAAFGQLQAIREPR